MRNINIIIIGLLLCTAINGQKSSKDFFKKIKNERVVSDESVTWKNIAPAMAGYNETYYCHPTDTNVMFMGPDMHVTYGTWDNGKSWQSIKDCDGQGDDMRRVIDFAFQKSPAPINKILSSVG